MLARGIRNNFLETKNQILDVLKLQQTSYTIGLHQNTHTQFIPLIYQLKEIYRVSQGRNHVTWRLSTPLKPKPQLVAFRFRSLKKVDWARFQDDLRQSELYTSPTDNACEFAEQLDTVCSSRFVGVLSTIINHFFDRRLVCFDR